jgi:TRAP-type mannitol/chloroaromatic compound transport system permease small subunit
MTDEPSAGAARGGPRPDVVGRVLDGVDRVCEWGGWASALCIIAILALITGEVVARNLFNYSIDIAWEFSAYLMGAAFMMGAGYSLRVGAQIRVRVLLDNLPPGSRRLVDLLATLLCCVIAAYLTAALAQLTWLSWVRESKSDKSSELPLWIAQAPLALGAALLALQSMARFCRVLRGESGEDVTQRVGQDAEAEAS